MNQNQPVGFLRSPLRYDVRVIGVSARGLDGELVTVPKDTFVERLGEWGQHSVSKTWQLKRALLLGLDGVRGGAFELSTFCFRKADHEVVLRGKVLEAGIYKDPGFPFPLLSVFAVVGECFWAILCRSEMYNPRHSFPVQFCGMPDSVTEDSFSSLPAGYDFGLDKFCEPKVGPVNGEVSEENTPDAEVAVQVPSAKLEKMHLTLPGESEHTALFCVEKVIPRHVRMIASSAAQLAQIGSEIRHLLESGTVELWKSELQRTLDQLLTFEKTFFTGLDLATEPPRDWHSHTPKFCASKVAPRLVGEIVASSAAVIALPKEVKPLFDVKTTVANELRGAIENLQKFLEVLKAKA